MCFTAVSNGELAGIFEEKRPLFRKKQIVTIEVDLFHDPVKSGERPVDENVWINVVVQMRRKRVIMLEKKNMEEKANVQKGNSTLIRVVIGVVVICIIGYLIYQNTDEV